jgi:cytochrome c
MFGEPQSFKGETGGMKTITTLLATFGLFLAVSGSCLGADARHGKQLFASPTLGGGTSGKSCLTCHENGRDFSPETLSRKQYLVMDNPVGSLAGVINFCIEVALRGQAIPENGKEMNDLIAYLKVFIKDTSTKSQ